MTFYPERLCRLHIGNATFGWRCRQTRILHIFQGTLLYLPIPTDPSLLLETKKKQGQRVTLPKPLSMVNSLVGLPLIITESVADFTTSLIHCLHCRKTPFFHYVFEVVSIHLIICYFKINFKKNCLFLPSFFLLYPPTHLLIKIPSKIWRSLTNIDYDLDTILPITLLTLFSSNFSNILRIFPLWN